MPRHVNRGVGRINDDLEIGIGNNFSGRGIDEKNLCIWVKRRLTSFLDRHFAARSSQQPIIVQVVEDRRSDGRINTV